jgi:hypothetical protein
MEQTFKQVFSIVIYRKLNFNMHFPSHKPPEPVGVGESSVKNFPLLFHFHTEGKVILNPEIR